MAISNILDKSISVKSIESNKSNKSNKSNESNKSIKSKKSKKSKKILTNHKKTFNETYPMNHYFTSFYNKNISNDNDESFLKSFTINYIFWITALVSVILLSYYDKNPCIVSGILSFLIAMFFGWYVHYVSHHFNLREFYLTFYNKHHFINTFISSFPGLHDFILFLCKYTFDFHDQIHHDTSINKTPINLTIEFLQNIITQGGAIVILSYFTLFSFSIFNYNIKINHSIVLLWCFLYASVHNINYNLMEPTCHIEHHIDPHTNYGIDTLDILFDVKYSKSNIEDFNHAAINIAVITLFFLFIKKFNYPFCKYLNKFF